MGIGFTLGLARVFGVSGGRTLWQTAAIFRSNVQRTDSQIPRKYGSMSWCAGRKANEVGGVEIEMSLGTGFILDTKAFLSFADPQNVCRCIYGEWSRMGTGRCYLNCCIHFTWRCVLLPNQNVLNPSPGTSSTLEVRGLSNIDNEVEFHCLVEPLFCWCFRIV